MQCPRSQHESPAGQKFCGECGTAVGQDTLAARFVSPEAYTPKHLAETIHAYRGSNH